MVRPSSLLLLASLVLSAPLTAQYPGGMGGMGRGRRAEDRRAARSGADRHPDLPTEAELQGPPDLQTLDLAVGIDTIPLAAYGRTVTAYLDSTRAARDSVWVAVERTRPSEDGGPMAGDSSSAAAGRRGAGSAATAWSRLKARDAAFDKQVLKRALAKKDFKKWDRWRADQIDQAEKARAERRRGDAS